MVKLSNSLEHTPPSGESGWDLDAALFGCSAMFSVIYQSHACFYFVCLTS